MTPEPGERLCIHVLLGWWVEWIDSRSIVITYFDECNPHITFYRVGRIIYHPQGGNWPQWGWRYLFKAAPLGFHLMSLRATVGLWAWSKGYWVSKTASCISTSQIKILIWIFKDKLLLILLCSPSGDNIFPILCFGPPTLLCLAFLIDYCILICFCLSNISSDRKGWATNTVLPSLILVPHTTLVWDCHCKPPLAMISNACL